MSVKLSPRPRKSRQRDEAKQEIVAQVHKPLRRDISSDREIYRTEPSEDSSESNRTYFKEDKNENISTLTPSREISIDGECQINSKILTLIENEMKRDINKHNHFTDSRPQSLSFYEEEKMPEELSGNLELLSPEEKKHYKRRKDHTQMDTDEMNAYNAIQDIYNRENDEMIINGPMKKSKSRKKRHQEPEVGLGDSREMMIPKEKRKTKKKRRECSPMSSSSSKRKHRKKEDDFEPRNDITIALEELQDDVFETAIEEFGRHEKVRKSPRKSDRLYVQKKNKFELANKENQCLNKNGESDRDKRFWDYYPIQIALLYQKKWISLSTFCHGLLGGLAFAHFTFMSKNFWQTHGEYVKYIANYNGFYTCAFYLLAVICLVSVFDKYDIAQLDTTQVVDLIRNKKRSIVIIIYLVCMTVHLVAAPVDDRINLYAYNSTRINITTDDVNYWNSLSFWRSFLAFFAWIIVASSPFEDLFQVHLKNMEKYVPE